MFCDQEYDISWRTSMCSWLERSVYSAAIWWKILCMSTWSKLFKTIISILIFYLVGLSMVQCEVLKFPVLDCCLFLLSSVKICLIYLASFDVQFSSVQSLSRVRLCDPMNRSMPGLPVHHQLLEFTPIHVHWVSDAIQPSDPLSSPSPLTFNLSQHLGLILIQK